MVVTVSPPRLFCAPVTVFSEHPDHLKVWGRGWPTPQAAFSFVVPSSGRCDLAASGRGMRHFSARAFCLRLFHPGNPLCFKSHGVVFVAELCAWVTEDTCCLFSA